MLTIAHRLYTIMDSDRVLVMEAGQAVELGHPYELLQNPDGYFRRLVDHTGQTSAATLQAAAEESFKRKAISEKENSSEPE